jgi:hypothetical protein
VRPPRPPAGPSAEEAAAVPDDRPILDLGGASPTPVASIDVQPRGLLPEGDDPILATGPGGPVRASDVARFLFRFAPDRALEALNQVLDESVLEIEAARHGVSVPPEVLTARVEQEVRSRESEIRVQFGPKWSLEEYLRDRFGFGVEAYRVDLLRLVRLQELRDRIVRWDALREDRIRIRVLVVADEEAARSAADRLAKGADFTALARQISLVPPDDLPSYPRDGIHPPELAEELFALPAGGVSRPVRVARDGREVFEVFKVVDVRAGRDIAWAEAAEEVERELRSRPVAAAEYLQWARRARERHGVRVLLVEPVKGAEKP